MERKYCGSMKRMASRSACFDLVVDVCMASTASMHMGVVRLRWSTH